MAGLVPANAPQGGAGQHPPGQGSVLEPLMNGQGSMGQRARAFAALVAGAGVAKLRGASAVTASTGEAQRSPGSSARGGRPPPPKPRSGASPRASRTRSATR